MEPHEEALHFHQGEVRWPKFVNWGAKLIFFGAAALAVHRGTIQEITQKGL